MMMPDIAISALRTFALFSDAQESTLRELAPSCVFQSFSAGIEINRVGQVPRYIYCLRSGSTEAWARLNDAETILATTTAPMVFEVAATIRNQPAALSIVTREACEALAIETAAFLKAVRDDRAVCNAALVHVSGTYLAMTHRLLDQKLRTAEQRLSQWILAEMDPSGRSPTVEIVFSKRALAYELGMSPANLSRLFNVLREHGIAVDGKTMTITNLKKLEALAQG
jgi:CRP-like cAMP-binding protein